MAREKRTKINARRMDGSVTKISGISHGVQRASVFARSHVLTVGSDGDFVAQLIGKRIQRRIVMKKVVTYMISIYQFGLFNFISAAFWNYQGCDKNSK
jgi:hypothetical protein